MNKDQAFKILEGRIDVMQTLMIESIEIIYNAAYNEAIEDAIKITEHSGYAEQIMELKK